METNLDIAKQIIKNHIKEAKYGIFDCRKLVGDPMYNLYNKDGLRIDICYYWEYFEVFGLSTDEFDELYDYYESIKGWYK